MKTLRHIFLCIVTVAFCVILFVACTEKKPLSILVLYEGAGHKEFCDATVPWLEKLGEENGFTTTMIKAPDCINDAYLSDFDVFIQLDYPPYRWSDENKAAFEKAIDNGTIGYIGMHHATLLGEFDGFPMWEWFGDFMGGVRFKDYIPELSDGMLVTENTPHPVLTGIEKGFVIPDDEWYTYDVSPRVHKGIKVLATVDEGSYSVDTQVKMGDHPVIWTNTAKKARNVYFQFGHSPKLVDMPEYNKLMLNSIFWAGQHN